MKFNRAQLLFERYLNDINIVSINKFNRKINLNINSFKFDTDEYMLSNDKHKLLANLFEFNTVVFYKFDKYTKIINELKNRPGLNIKINTHEDFYKRNNRTISYIYTGQIIHNEQYEYKYFFYIRNYNQLTIKELIDLQLFLEDKDIIYKIFTYDNIQFPNQDYYKHFLNFNICNNK